MQLVYKKSRKPVKVGDRVTIGYLADRSVVEIASIEEPRHPGSTGRVYLKAVKRGRVVETEGMHGYFPAVIDAIWTDCEHETCRGRPCAWPKK